MATTSNSYVINAQAAQMHPFNRAQTTTPTQKQPLSANLQPGFQTPSPSSTDMGHHQGFLFRQGVLSAASSPAPVYSSSHTASPAGYPPSGYPPAVSGPYGTRPSSATGLKRPPTPASRFASDGFAEVSKKLVLPGIETLLAPITPPPRGNQSSPDGQMFRYSGPSPFPVTPMQSPSVNAVSRSPVNLPSFRSLEREKAGSGTSDTTSPSSETPSTTTSQPENGPSVSTAACNDTNSNNMEQQQMNGTLNQDDFGQVRNPVAHAAPVPSHPIVISGHEIMGGSPMDYYGHQYNGAVVTQQLGNSYAHPGQHSHAGSMQQHHMHQQHQQNPYGYSPTPNQAFNTYYNGYPNQYPIHTHGNGSPSVPQDIERHHIGMGIYTVNGPGNSMLDCQMMNGAFSFQTGNGTHPPLITSKDIKRRTKTGCLTCRKRRIKVSNISDMWMKYFYFFFLTHPI